MCCGGKCLFYINIKFGSLIFGYISAVISAIGTLLTVGMTMVFLALFVAGSQSANDFTMNAGVMFPLMLEFLSAFICSVLLLVGITQNKPSLVNTYIIYGMLQIVMLFVFFIMIHCFSGGYLLGLLVLESFVLGLYGLCLYMIFLTLPVIGAKEFVSPSNVIEV